MGVYRLSIMMSLYVPIYKMWVWTPVFDLLYRIVCNKIVLITPDTTGNDEYGSIKDRDLSGLAGKDKPHTIDR